jgi:hypothetical protein
MGFALSYHHLIEPAYGKGEIGGRCAIREKLRALCRWDISQQNVSASFAAREFLPR